MPKRISTAKQRPDNGLDFVQNAKRVSDEAISRSETSLELVVSQSTISFVMAQMGRKGGKIGGKRRMETLTPERRQEIGRQAAMKRWGTKKKVAKKSAK
jgi:hypothetical protein